jgi:hypothetical protein
MPLREIVVPMRVKKGAIKELLGRHQLSHHDRDMQGFSSSYLH